MKSERTAPLSNVDDPVDELGHLFHQRCEFVDDDDKAGRSVGIATALKFKKVFGLLRVQDVLPTTQFGVQRAQRPAHQMRAEVGNEPHVVRQVHAVGKRCATLVVDEEEVHAGWAVRCRHADDPALQKLALACTSRSTDQSVWAVGSQVEVETIRCALTDERLQVVVALQSWCVRPGGQRVGATPTFGDITAALGQFQSAKRKERDAAGQVALIFQ